MSKVEKTKEVKEVKEVKEIKVAPISKWEHLDENGCKVRKPKGKPHA